jgi:CheY-like chemotaxis protein
LEKNGNIDLLLIDFAMPGMSGAEVARRVRTTRPALPILFVTGYADRAALEGVSAAHIIGKPFLDNELHDKVRTALSQRTAGKVVALRPN